MTSRSLVALAVVLIVAAGLGMAYIVADVQPRHDEAVQASLQYSADARDALARGDPAAAQRSTAAAEERGATAAELDARREVVGTSAGVGLLVALVAVAGAALVRLSRPGDPATAPLPVLGGTAFGAGPATRPVPCVLPEPPTPPFVPSPRGGCPDTVRRPAARRSPLYIP